MEYIFHLHMKICRMPPCVRTLEVNVICSTVNREEFNFLLLDVFTVQGKKQL